MIIDLLIIIFGISAFFRGKEIGFVRQLFSTIGFFAGLYIGSLFVPQTIQLVHSPASRSIVTLVTTLGGALILLSVGEYIGLILKHKVMLRSINFLDNILGSGLSVISLLVSVWLTAAILVSLPLPPVQTAVRSSRIIAKLDQILPSATTIIADFSHLIEPNGFPQVFIGNEPSPNANITVPNMGTLAAAVTKDQASVVKIEGQGCGGIVEGSGFVIAKGLVATNAHVIAGIRQPYVEDNNGTQPAKAIWFDPNLDFAVLSVPGLTEKPLTVVPGIASNGTPAAVLGYPGGGPFNAGPAAVMDNFIATGRNIYGTGHTNRSIYELRANVIPGNSGGPLINKNGGVIGIVFAESTTYNHVGYALTTNKVLSEISQAEKNRQPTSTGNCAE